MALTFDDAPFQGVAPVLQILDAEQVKATFFGIGQSLEGSPELARAIVAAGHQLGNHTYSHRQMLLRSPAFIEPELGRTGALIRAAGYQGPIYFRPPYGKKLVLLPWYLWRHDITTVMWDVEPDTYAGAISTAERAAFISQYTLEHVRPGPVILMHPLCGEACAPDRQALPDVIAGLRGRGYRFVTVSELLSYALQ